MLSVHPVLDRVARDVAEKLENFLSAHATSQVHPALLSIDH